MPADGLVIRKKNEPFSIRRWMREPVVQFIRRDLFLFGAVGFHPPDLHRAGTLRVEVNIFSVRRVIRSVIESFRVREAFFLPASRCDGINIELAVALGAINQSSAVR